MPSWDERHRAWLTTQFARWQAALAGGLVPLQLEDPHDLEPTALRLAERFGLSRFETTLVVLAAGLELDGALAAAVARRTGQPVLTVDAALALLPEPHWDAFAPDGPLRRALLITLDPSDRLAAAPLRLDERVLHFVAGVAAFDAQLAGRAAPAEPPRPHPDADRVAAAMAGHADPLVMLPHPPHDAAARRAARALAIATLAALARSAIEVDVGGWPTDPMAAEAFARRLDREAALDDAGLLLALPAHATAPEALARGLAELRGPVFVLGRLSPRALADMPPRPVLSFAVDAPTADLRDAAPALRRALQQFRVEPDVVQQALRSVPPGPQADTALWTTLREAARGGLDTLAERLVSPASFDDLVVPDAIAQQLREITAQLRHRATVHDDWGFAARQSRGLGLSALFAGDSGTGKTLAAEAIAHEAGLDLYRVDLSATVSKYIGETEKNLAQLFDAAERCGAVLLFDEADALFGQRSEVRDSHDRYANLEVAYLLQRIEHYPGLAILTSNMKSVLDRAFLRRLRFVVQFPFPDAALRARLWQRALPPQAPVQGLDAAQLARLHLSGGSIRTVALNAAFHAAERGTPIDAACITLAAQAEFAKLERGPVEVVL
jgi:AAA+ superfamily predicted ATPase